jgi:hypothetical protein
MAPSPIRISLLSQARWPLACFSILVESRDRGFPAIPTVHFSIVCTGFIAAFAVNSAQTILDKRVSFGAPLQGLLLARGGAGREEVSD